MRMRGRGTRQNQFNGLRENQKGPEVKTKQTEDSIIFLEERQGHWASHCPEDCRDRQIWGVLTYGSREAWKPLQEPRVGKKCLNCNWQRQNCNWQCGQDWELKFPRGLGHRGGSHFCRAPPGSHSRYWRRKNLCRPSSKARGTEPFWNMPEPSVLQKPVFRGN